MSPLRTHKAGESSECTKGATTNPRWRQALSSPTLLPLGVLITPTPPHSGPGKGKGGPQVGATDPEPRALSSPLRPPSPISAEPRGMSVCHALEDCSLANTLPPLHSQSPLCSLVPHNIIKFALGSSILKNSRCHPVLSATSPGFFPCADFSGADFSGCLLPPGTHLRSSTGTAGRGHLSSRLDPGAFLVFIPCVALCSWTSSRPGFCSAISPPSSSQSTPTLPWVYPSAQSWVLGFLFY